MSERMNSASILRRQQKVSANIDSVHRFVAQGRPFTATIANDNIHRIGSHIDYRAIGLADLAAFDAEDSASSVEMSELAEITGEAWPYYPDLARHAMASRAGSETLARPTQRER